jgi:hypothetical protein
MMTVVFEGRRKFKRVHAEGKVTILSIGQNGNQETIPLYLRDTSEGGLSGTFFGNSAPSNDICYFLLGDQKGLVPIRLVWSNGTIDGIFMLGFEKTRAS